MVKLRIVFLISFLLIVCIFLALYIVLTQHPSIKENYVIEIKDGDTFVIDSGETIRLLCVDTPEIGQEGYENATFFLSELVLGKEIMLENPENYSFQKEDHYGRSLYFAYILNNEGKTETLINKEIILNNHSKIYDFNYSFSKVFAFYFFN